MKHFISVMGLNEGNKTVQSLHTQRPTRVFRLKGVLGQATDTYFSDGKVVEKATFWHVNRSKLDAVLASIQAAHQKQMFQYVQPSFLKKNDFVYC